MTENVISVDTVVRIYNAHREIEAGQQLLKLLRQGKSEWQREPASPIPRNDQPFGGDTRRWLTLGSNTLSSSKHIANVDPELAIYIIEAHVARKTLELKEACVIARMELDGVTGENLARDEGETCSS